MTEMAIVYASESHVDRLLHNAEQVEQGSAPTDKSWYVPLYKAALRGDWESAKSFLDIDKDAATAKITVFSATALHVVVGTGRAIHFVQNLVHLMTAEALAMCDDLGNTALNVAALVGNTEAAVILVKKNPSLLYIRNDRGWLPVHRAALCAHKDTLLYLLGRHKVNTAPEFLMDQYGVELLVYVIESGFFDVAMDLVQSYPKLGKTKLENGDSALKTIARMSSAFPSGNRLSFWQNLIFSCVPLKMKKKNKLEDPNICDIENLNDTSEVPTEKYSSTRLLPPKYCVSVRRKMHCLIWDFTNFLVPQAKHMENKKYMQYQALHLVETLCKEILSLNDSIAYASFYEKPILEAAKLGIPEVVQRIVDVFPDAVYSKDKDNHYLFEVAVLNRCENVFNLIYQTTEYKQYATLLIDNSGNNILHLAARLAPSEKLHLVSGAALQMQSEIQWFKEVANFVVPTYKEKKNSDQETPAMVFLKEHKNLIIEGEKWMKNMANSFIIAAALIATVVFAAAVTVPGGDDQNTVFPLLNKDIKLIVFAISDAISLFTSVVSMLMFLSILTSRYSEWDFLDVLPKRLIIGLLALFISTTSMMIAFSSSLYLVFGSRSVWHLIVLFALGFLTIICFAALQFPLLVDVICSTYGPGIFGERSNVPFY